MKVTRLGFVCVVGCACYAPAGWKEGLFLVQWLLTSYLDWGRCPLGPVLHIRGDPCFRSPRGAGWMWVDLYNTTAATTSISSPSLRFILLSTSPTFFLFSILYSRLFSSSIYFLFIGLYRIIPSPRRVFVTSLLHVDNPPLYSLSLFVSLTFTSLYFILTLSFKL